MRHLLLLFVIIAAVFAIGCEEQKAKMSIADVQSAEVPSISNFNLVLDKEVYHSGEVMKINGYLESSSRIENVSVRFFGINARNSYALDNTRQINISEGKNLILFDYKAPPCNTCAGIKAGIYKINAEIVYENNTIANATADVEIQQ
jgi:hypothetical protein